MLADMYLQLWIWLCRIVFGFRFSIKKKLLQWRGWRRWKKRVFFPLQINFVVCSVYHHTWVGKVPMLFSLICFTFCFLFFFPLACGGIFEMEESQKKSREKVVQMIASHFSCKNLELIYPFDMYRRPFGAYAFRLRNVTRQKDNNSLKVSFSYVVCGVNCRMIAKLTVSVMILDFLVFLFSTAYASVRLKWSVMSERSFKTRPQCGLCNAVSNVFRRLLCVGPSRRGSSESYYQQLDFAESYERENEQVRTCVVSIPYTM